MTIRLKNQSQVCILMSVYNGGHDLEPTIWSVLNQRFRDFEFVIFDDGSTDGTDEVLSYHQLREPRMTVIKNEQQKGLTHNLVRGVNASNAPYIARIDCGDRWLVDKLQKQIALLEMSPSIILCGTQVEHVTPDNETLGFTHCPIHDQGIRRCIHEERPNLSHPSIVFRNKINYRELFYYSQDLDLYLRASLKGKLFCLNEALTQKLHHKNSITFQHKHLQRQYQRHAYRLHRIETEQGVAATKSIQSLKIRNNAMEASLSKGANALFSRFAAQKTKGRSILIWGSLLFGACILYPPLLKDYCIKLYKRAKGKCALSS